MPLRNADLGATLLSHRALRELIQLFSVVAWAQVPMGLVVQVFLSFVSLLARQQASVFLRQHNVFLYFHP